MNALVAVFPLMLIVTLTVIMLQVRSFTTMFMVFATAPLGLVGAVPTLLVFHQPFGFNAILGLIALSGILMRNTLILVDQIHHDRAAGLSDYEAIVESTVRRARPVILTAAAAMLAFIPLTHSVFWGALAYVLIGGVGVGTLLTLLFLPALYALWFRVRRAPRRNRRRIRIRRDAGAGAALIRDTDRCPGDGAFRDRAFSRRTRGASAGLRPRPLAQAGRLSCRDRFASLGNIAAARTRDDPSLDDVSHLYWTSERRRIRQCPGSRRNRPSSTASASSRSPRRCSGSAASTASAWPTSWRPPA